MVRSRTITIAVKKKTGDVFDGNFTISSKDDA